MFREDEHFDAVFPHEADKNCHDKGGRAWLVAQFVRFLGQLQHPSDWC